jgi:hypothetical protein
MGTLFFVVEIFKIDRVVASLHPLPSRDDDRKTYSGEVDRLGERVGEGTIDP